MESEARSLYNVELPAEMSYEIPIGISELPLRNINNTNIEFPAEMKVTEDPAETIQEIILILSNRLNELEKEVKAIKNRFKDLSENEIKIRNEIIKNIYKEITEMGLHRFINNTKES